MAEDTKKEEEKKNKKINRMNLEEVEKALENTKVVQKGLNSKYAIELQKRKSLLTAKK